MNAGELRHRIDFEEPTYTTNAAGEQVLTWAVAKSDVWANVRPLRAMELERARGVQLATTHIVKLRFDPDILPTWRIKWIDSRGITNTLQIIDLIDVSARGVELNLTCQAVSE